MSEIASVVERTRRAHAAISQLEAEIERSPGDWTLQLNLAAMKRTAEQAEQQLLRYSEEYRIEVCDYRLLPSLGAMYALRPVSDSMGSYQNLFSQIYDAKRNGAKSNAVIGSEALQESMLEFGYSTAGRLEWSSCVGPRQISSERFLLAL